MDELDYLRQMISDIIEVRQILVNTTTTNFETFFKKILDDFRFQKVFKN
jgi:hypothetical protein